MHLAGQVQVRRNRAGKQKMDSRRPTATRTGRCTISRIDRALTASGSKVGTVLGWTVEWC